MARVKLQLPKKFSFVCSIPIRITDINYGGHVGNDTVLTLLHEARMQYLNDLGYTEMNFGGTGMIMADVTIEFKSELFYGDVVIASVATGEISKIGFDIFYKLEKETADKRIIVAHATTAMICYDYEKKKIVSVPDEAKKKIGIC
ncbi:MAG TPA: thioesterase family protein [Chitinophagaceae bacterium]|nr:thioesterase family protein [Chitinophagaceae bacterium]